MTFTIHVLFTITVDVTLDLIYERVREQQLEEVA